MNPMMKHPVDFDREDSRNAGITGCFLFSFDGRGMACLVEYADPESATEYKFLATATQLQPGEIAWLYYFRWRIEKTFDTFERDLEKRQTMAAEKGHCLSPFLDASRRMAKLSLQYIRCFRKYFFGKSPPEIYLADFASALRAYL